MIKNLLTLIFAYLIGGNIFSQSKSDSSSNNKFFIDIYGNYGFLPTGKVVLGTKSTPSGIENVYGSYGQGISYGGNFGYMFNKYCSGELGLSILSGNDVKYFISSLENSSSKGKMSRIELAAKITTGNKLKPYMKFGVIYGIKTEIKSYYSYTGSVINSLERKYYGGSCFGYKGSLGVDYKIKKLFSVFLELQIISISWAPDKVDWTQTNSNGNNVYTYTGSTNFVDKITGYSYNSNYQELKTYYPFGSFGLTTGLKLMFGRIKK